MFAAELRKGAKPSNWIRRQLSAPSAIIVAIVPATSFRFSAPSPAWRAFGSSGADPRLAATSHATPLRQGFGVAGTRATTAVEAAVSAAMFKILQATSLRVASAWQARPLQRWGRFTRTALRRLRSIAPTLYGNDDVTHQIAQMGFRVCCGELLAAYEYRFDDLLSQMTASFEHRANTLSTRPFGMTA